MNFSSEKNYITVLGLKRLQDEYDYLIQTERPKTVKVVKWAASLGDRSENADYQYGKKKLREIDRRLRFLKKRIELAEVVEPEKMVSQKIQFGATVKVTNELGEDKEFIIVGEDETMPREGRVSWKSPVGRSLLGKKVGDDVVVRSPKADIEYEVLEVRYEKIVLPEWSPENLI